MTEEIKPCLADPSNNVRSMVEESVERLDDIRKSELNRVDEKILSLDDKIDERDAKYQVQFNAAKDAVSIALIAQEKAVAAALDATKEAIGKAEIATDKRFDLLSEKIDNVSETLNKSSGQSGLYVTQTDLNIALDKLSTSIEITLRPVVAFMNASSGKSSGISQSWGYLIGGVGVTAAVVTVILRVLGI